MNSRPLLPIHSTSEDGSDVITVYCANKICHIRRWNLVNRLIADLWEKWHHVYLQTLQQRHKWNGTHTNLQKNDIVLLKEKDTTRRSWPLARITDIHPGADGLVRVVTILCDGHLYKRAVEKLVPLVRQRNDHFPAQECVQACEDA